MEQLDFSRSTTHLEIPSLLSLQLDSFREFEPRGGHYTWWSYQGDARKRNIGWRIDYVCVSHALRSSLRSAFIQPEIGGSDHCPVGIDLG